ncbi:sulfur carrier protein ThiS [Aliikangiella sp. G2MR2-5]|uniref:sulfur carrier protein ThiS n=1 Tax=Aliikangiella sp. G2MR2-5 TaxID=2788943 RepID=UPI0018A8A1C9|nr:sulfur carrier protein ThiS [Aliikangiella sp. G2MR2-5]
MPQVIVNGQITDVVESNLAEFLSARQNAQSSFAVALNETFVPKAEYQNTLLKEGDRIELVSPMQGG